MFWREKRDRGLDAQIDAAMAWAVERLRDDEAISIVFPERYERYETVWSHTNAGRELRRIPTSRTQDDDRSVRFLIGAPQTPPTADEWRDIITTPYISVLEKQSAAGRQHDGSTGALDQSERELVLSIARKSLAFFLQFHRVPNVNPRKNVTLFPLPRTLRTDEIPDTFLRKTDINVALWCDGALRGSSIIENQHLVEGIVLGAIDAARDQRFKPLTSTELERTRIEVSIFSDLRIPLSKTELQSNVIYPEKGYLLQGGAQNGWFLPEVHNVRYFQNLHEFLDLLSREKAKASDRQRTHAYIFDIDNFIESEDRLRTHCLRGPVVWDTHNTSSKQILLDALHESAECICRTQESDGYVPIVLEPLSARKNLSVDWPRMAFTCFALSAFGSVTGSVRYQESAEQGYAFLQRYLQERRGSTHRPVASHYLTTIYTARLATSLGRTREARELCFDVATRIPDAQSFDPIVLGQLMSLLLTQKRTNYLEERIAYVASLAKRQFESHVQYGSPMSHAAWSELVVAFHIHDPVFAERVAEWLMGAQLPSGAFANTTESMYEYARGTTKIFEVLCRDFTKHRGAVEKALRWIYTMRYTKENMYFMSDDIQERMRGGLRADLLNPNVHIDAVGHFLLGGVYCIEQGIFHD